MSDTWQGETHTTHPPTPSLAETQMAYLKCRNKEAAGQGGAAPSHQAPQQQKKRLVFILIVVAACMDALASCIRPPCGPALSCKCCRCPSPLRRRLVAAAGGHASTSKRAIQEDQRRCCCHHPTPAPPTVRVQDQARDCCHPVTRHRQQPKSSWMCA